MSWRDFRSYSAAYTALYGRTSARRFMQYLDPAGVYTKTIGMIAECQWLPRYSWWIPKRRGLSCSCNVATITSDKTHLRRCGCGRKNEPSSTFLKRTMSRQAGHLVFPTRQSSSIRSIWWHPGCKLEENDIFLFDAICCGESSSISKSLPRAT